VAYKLYTLLATFKINDMFKRKIKVTFYMKSGNVFLLKFKEFEISKLSSSKGNREMTYKGNEKTFTVDIDQIECVVIG
jgi:hypothetical protein